MRNRTVMLIISLLFACPALRAQENTAGTDTTLNKAVDIYKEFSLTSFADEEPPKIIDSTTLRQHLIGIKWGYSLSNVAFSEDITHKPIGTPKNFGIYYTYYHSLWDKMPYFGFHTGIEYNEIGYKHIVEGDPDAGTATTETECLYQALEWPLLSQFRVDFWKMRLLINIGPYGYYILSTEMEGGIPQTTNRAGIGLMGGLGLAFVFNPVEFHIEGNYKYTMSHFYDPSIYSQEYWVYTHSNQIVLSFGLFFRLGGGKK